MRSNVPEIFGSMVFNDSIMRDKLPKDIYKSLRKTIEANKNGLPTVWAADKSQALSTHRH